MSKPSKKRMEKKKKHEREDYKKLLNRRKRIRTEAKEEKKRWKVENENRIRIKPVVKEQPKPHARTPEEIADQIEDNYRALKALEDEYEREVNERQGLNKALEEEGFATLQEKMDFLNKQAMEQAQESIERSKSAMKLS